jgi:hypothetical protein
MWIHIAFHGSNIRHSKSWRPRPDPCIQCSIGRLRKASCTTHINWPTVSSAASRKTDKAGPCFRPHGVSQRIMYCDPPRETPPGVTGDLDVRITTKTLMDELELSRHKGRTRVYVGRPPCGHSLAGPLQHMRQLSHLIASPRREVASRSGIVRRPVSARESIRLTATPDNPARPIRHGRCLRHSQTDSTKCSR